MKRQVKLLLLLFSLIAMISGAQTPLAGKPVEQDRQTTGYWIDPATKLMWPAKDNGKPVTWRQAVKYCRGLRLDGVTDWRQPTLDELATLVDKRAPIQDSSGKGDVVFIPVGNRGRHVKGNLSLAGDPWSSNRPLNRFGHPYNEEYFFDFAQAKPSYDLQLFRNTKYALCVHSPI